MKKVLFAIACLFVATGHAQNVRVAAAGNLRFVLEDIKAKYIRENPGSKVDITFGASGALTQQIINGATFDFFMAADIRFPQEIKEQGFAAGAVKTYAFGRLVLWSNIVDVSSGIQTLTSKNISRIAIAKPDVAPYGERAVECLKYYSLYGALKNKLVYADNIAQAAQFASTGNVEAAFLAYALIFGPGMKDNGNCYVLDTNSYRPVEQACLLLREGGQNPEAVKFMKFVLSTECKPLFEKYGYIVP